MSRRTEVEIAILGSLQKHGPASFGLLQWRLWEFCSGERVQSALKNMRRYTNEIHLKPNGFYHLGAPN